MITKEEVQHIAKLARLGITKKEEERFSKELSPILDYIEKLKEVDISEVEPTSHSIKIENITRKDESRNSETDNQKLLNLAPETKEDYLKVKSVFK